MQNDPRVLAEFGARLAADRRQYACLVESPEAPPTVRGWFGGETRAASFNDQLYTSAGLSSAASFDRYNTILEPEGWMLEAYRKNPVVLVNHQDFGANGIPVARSIEDRPVDDGLFSRTQFAVRELEGITTRVAEIWALHRGGYFGALSVSFIPHEWEEFKEKEVRGIRITRMEKLEHSLVSVPGNGDAVTLGFAKIAVGAARRFGRALPATALEGDLGLISQAARLAAASEDLTQSLLEAPGGDPLVLARVEELRRKYLRPRLAPQPKEVASFDVAAAVARLRAIADGIRETA